ncbi:unnamed protein product [Soboliphyme baturini]|uniref:Uncharacterized protein n=1 Tax=Soboliphyme baturini TaxID=241478 RepID=A0A183JAJ4_9BILA|nr:unnamed protein product [Soboliphyme baturini]
MPEETFEPETLVLCGLPYALDLDFVMDFTGVTCLSCDLLKELGGLLLLESNFDRLCREIVLFIPDFWQLEADRSDDDGRLATDDRSVSANELDVIRLASSVLLDLSSSKD